MPTPASRAIARIDGSVPADTNTRVATSRSWSRLRVASARSTRVPESAKTDHAPIMVRCLLQTEHSPLLVAFIRRQKETAEHATTGRQHTGDHEPSGPARVIRRPRGPEHPRGTRTAGRPGADPRARHRGRTEPDGLVHDLRRTDRHSIRLEPAVRVRNRLCRGRGPGR